MSIRNSLSVTGRFLLMCGRLSMLGEVLPLDPGGLRGGTQAGGSLFNPKE